MTLIAGLILMLVSGGIGFAAPADTLCAARAGVFPIYFWATEDDPPARFEIRQCPGNGLIQVALFEARKTKPSVFVDALKPWSSLFHMSNVLVLQTASGSSNTVYIFRFNKGKTLRPRLEPTSGFVKVRIDDNSYRVVVNVPAGGRIGHRFPARTYRFPLASSWE